MARVPSRGSDQFVVRFPEGMRDRIRQLAEENGRSMNAQILYMLEFAIEEMELAAQVYAKPDKELYTSDVLRHELRKTQAMLTQVLADIEDPASGLNKHLRDEIKQATGVSLPDNATPANKTTSEIDEGTRAPSQDTGTRDD